MNSTNEGLVEPRVFGPPHMRMVELPVSAVVADPAFNCRPPYTAEEIAEACSAFEQAPMLHPPAVACVDGQWQLIAGFLRFSVWQRQGVELGLFRWVEVNDARELRLTNLAENLMRRDMRAPAMVETVTQLREEGFDASVIAQYCGKSARWVRRIYKLKQSAHPELWSMFVSGSPQLTLARMLDLADHPADQQMAKWKKLLTAADQADEVARGYPAEPARDRVRPGAAAAVRRQRRRFPTRRRSHQVRKLLERAPTLGRDYRQGALDVLDWFLFGKELPVRVSVSAVTQAGTGQSADGGPLGASEGSDADRSTE